MLTNNPLKITMNNNFFEAPVFTVIFEPNPNLISLAYICKYHPEILHTIYWKE